MAEDVISIDYKFQEGTAFFHGTKIPVKKLFDYLEQGKSIETFIKDNPSVSILQINSVLEQAEKLLENNSVSVNGMII
jgi:uncharacterized protein (DUF433 family)